YHPTTATEIYTLSLHDALPILHPLGGSEQVAEDRVAGQGPVGHGRVDAGEVLLDHGAGSQVEVPHLGVAHLPLGEAHRAAARLRSEEHTSELQSHLNLVCRLLL